MINKKIFNSADLDVSYIFTYVHNLNTSSILVKWYDNNGQEQPTANSLTIVDANTITLDCAGDIIGDHALIIYYEGSGSVTGKKAFDLTNQITEPDADDRLILGQASTPAFNITWARLKAWMAATLAGTYMDTVCGNVFSAATARGNLGVYSTTQVDAAVNAKASLYQAGSGAVLGVANTLAFTPMANYHPSTKLYSDNPTRSAVTLIGTRDANITAVDLNITLKGGQLVFEGTISAATAYTLADAKYVGTIPGYVNPGHIVVFNAVETLNQYPGTGKILTNGEIYFSGSGASRTYVINFALNYLA